MISDRITVTSADISTAIIVSGDVLITSECRNQHNQRRSEGGSSAHRLLEAPIDAIVSNNGSMRSFFANDVTFQRTYWWY